MGDTLGKQTGINLEHFAGEWKLFGRKWGADEGERQAAGRPLCQQCGSKQLLASGIITAALGRSR